MADDDDGDNFVILDCKDPNLSTTTHPLRELAISVDDVSNWDLDSILSHQAVKVKANRTRLIQESSYFRGLLGGDFSESCMGCIPIQCNMESLISVLKFIHGCTLDVTWSNFVSLFEGALYFGVESIVINCKTWFSDATSARSQSMELPLDDIIEIWMFTLDHDDSIPELCVGYLARNFMRVMSCSSFGDIPYELLYHCIQHTDLTIDSEKHLSEALLVWLAANADRSKWFGSNYEERFGILKEIRISLLPLWFVAGKRTCPYFSGLSVQRISRILSLLKDPSTGYPNVLDFAGDDLRIRLTEFSEKMNLSGCPQITSAVLLFSLLPRNYNMNSSLRIPIDQPLMKLECFLGFPHQTSDKLLPTLSYEAVLEVDISKCTRLNIDVAINCFSKSFPSLRILKAAYCPNFRLTSLHKLVEKCSSVDEVDLSAHICSIPWTKSLAWSHSPASRKTGYSLAYVSGFKQHISVEQLQNISKLTLEGRSDVTDSDLFDIAGLCISLTYLNLKGCVSISDVGLSRFIVKCKMLHSIVASDTSFGKDSVAVLCSGISKSSRASKLLKLHIGGCYDIDEATLLELVSQLYLVKSLCLRNTNLVDDALYSFSGSSLERLHVSSTKVSGAALAYLVRKNPGLKNFKARDCKNLCQEERNAEGVSTIYSSGELYSVLGETFSIEKISLGWGFTPFSLEALKPAITSMRTISVGLGGSLGQDALTKLPMISPMLQEVSLFFQVLSDDVIQSIMKSLSHLEMLALCYCLGDISPSSFNIIMPNLKTLKLERVTPWMTNDHLIMLTRNFPNLIKLSLLGCKFLNLDSQVIIAQRWPGLISLHLEDCGEVTRNGARSLFDCRALEDLLLRHNGCGIQNTFIMDAASELPMLRSLSLDWCDASGGHLDMPEFDDSSVLITVKIARCKQSRKTYGRPIHRETAVEAWNGKRHVSAVLDERV